MRPLDGREARRNMCTSNLPVAFRPYDESRGRRIEISKGGAGKALDVAEKSEAPRSTLVRE